jgi:hypothetical protein
MNLEFFTSFPDITYERIYLSYIAGTLVSGVAIAYAIQIYRIHLHVSIATWGMMLLIDMLGLMLALKSGNAHPSIHTARVITDVLICIAILAIKVNWRWTRLETFSFIVFATSVWWWLTLESLWSVFGYLVACAFTILPQAYQSWKDRRLARKSAWIWIVNSVALVMTMLSLHTISFEYSVVTLGLLTLNLAMVLIALR